MRILRSVIGLLVGPVAQIITLCGVQTASVSGVVNGCVFVLWTMFRAILINIALCLANFLSVFSVTGLVAGYGKTSLEICRLGSTPLNIQHCPGPGPGPGGGGVILNPPPPSSVLHLLYWRTSAHGGVGIFQL